MPVFLLAGGPIGEYDFDKQSEIDELNRLRRTLDVITISQKGNPDARGLVPSLVVHQPAGASLYKETNVDIVSKLSKRDYQEALRHGAPWALMRGYDIMNIVDDVYDLRDA